MTWIASSAICSHLARDFMFGSWNHHIYFLRRKFHFSKVTIEEVNLSLLYVCNSSDWKMSRMACTNTQKIEKSEAIWSLDFSVNVHTIDAHRAHSFFHELRIKTRNQCIDSWTQIKIEIHSTFNSFKIHFGFITLFIMSCLRPIHISMEFELFALVDVHYGIHQAHRMCL